MSSDVQVRYCQVDGKANPDKTPEDCKLGTSLPRQQEFELVLTELGGDEVYRFLKASNGQPDLWHRVKHMDDIKAGDCLQVVKRPGAGAVSALSSVAAGDELRRLVVNAVKEATEDTNKVVQLLLFSSLSPRSSSSKPAEYRPAAMKKYNVQASDKKVLCMVSGRWYPDDKVRAGHIIPQRSSVALFQAMGIRKHASENIIFMHETIEMSYDNLEWCILVEEEEFTIYKIHVLKPGLLDPNRWIDSDRLKWSDLHGKNITVPQGATTMPSKRCVTLHAQSAIENAISKGWIEEGDVQVPASGWSSPTFAQSLMQQYLSGIDQAGAPENDGFDADGTDDSSIAV